MIENKEKVGVETPSDTPFSNRGVSTTYKSAICSVTSGVYVIFDWLQITVFPFNKKSSDLEDFIIDVEEYIKRVQESWFYKSNITRFNDVYDLFFYLFGVPRTKVLFDVDRPQYGYEHCYSFNNIKIFDSPTRPEMGVHIQLSGQGCRELEELGIEYYELFEKLVPFKPHFTRIDVSFDDFTGKYWTLSKISKHLKNKEVVTNFKTCYKQTKYNISDYTNIGYSIQFGSRGSDVEFTFYDKIKERKNNNPDLDLSKIDNWNRFECRFRNEYASKIIANYLYHYGESISDVDINLMCDSFESYIIGVVSGFISFKINNGTELKNRYRWSNATWWNNFIKDSEKIKLKKQPVTYSLIKTKAWLDRSVSRSNFNVLLADCLVDGDNIISNYLYEMFLDGKNKFTLKDLNYVNQYLLSQGKSPYSYDDVMKLFDSVKEVLLVK